MINFEYSLYDSQRRTISATAFSKARYLSIWADGQLVVRIEKIPTDYKTSQEIQNYIYDYTVYLESEMVAPIVKEKPLDEFITQGFFDDLKDYSFSLFDTNLNIISADRFARARYFSLWFKNTQKFEYEMIPTIYRSAIDKEDYVYYFIKELIKEKKKKAQKRKQTIHEKEAQHLLEEPEFVETVEYNVRERYKELTSKDDDLGNFRIKKFDVKFKDMLMVDPMNPMQVQEAMEKLREAFSNNFPKIFNEANQYSPRKAKKQIPSFIITT
jgi:hypothetical protein